MEGWREGYIDCGSFFGGEGCWLIVPACVAIPFLGTLYSTPLIHSLRVFLQFIAIISSHLTSH